MDKVLEGVSNYISINITSLFHDRCLEKLDDIQLNVILRRKNPYLFRAKNILESHHLVGLILDAALSSSEETIFGNFIENVACETSRLAYAGHKSSTVGIDLEFTKDEVRYLVTIKSGPNWSNAGQIAKMKSNFMTAQKTLRTSGGYKGQVQCIEGCCYGIDDKPDKGSHFKFCGQRFWSFVSGQETFYQDIIEPLGNVARRKTEAFQEQLAQKRNLLTQEFSERFCKNGIIDWPKLVKYNSGINKD
ncbi:MAG: PmeII family type II restriction endonuclease [Alphaproteobacteria bacterium]|nr:PmeII family type II restriction endonuclease [Alphaproteobacteria bacterium]